MIDQNAIDRATAFDTAIASVGAAQAAHRTHGDQIVPKAPTSIDLPTKSAMALKMALFTCVWRLTTTRPLG